MNASHMWICGGFVLVAVVVLAITGSAWILVPALACMAMMGAMVWMMMRMGSGPGRDPEQ